MQRSQKTLARLLLILFVANFFAAANAQLLSAGSGVLVQAEAVSMLGASGDERTDQHHRVHHSGQFCDHSCHSFNHLVGITSTHLMAFRPIPHSLLCQASEQALPRAAPDSQFRPPRA